MKMYEILWKNVMDEVENKTTMLVFDTYFKAIKPLDLKEETIYLSVPSETCAEVITSRYHKVLLDAFKDTQSGIKNYSLSVSGGSKATYSSDEEEDLSSPIDPNYTFENFVVGESNRYLYAAARAVSANPGTTYNPLYIYGDTGLGKTHIMHAIANQIKADNPEKNVLYATCEKFTTDLISKIKSGRAYQEGTENFRDKYRKVDVLIIDDIQFLARKQSTQEEFFHTFNELYGQNKQIILSSDVPPSEIETLTERLRTRFEGGLMAQVIAPDIETKIAILQKKGEGKKAIISYEVANFIAESSSNDIRSLEGLLNKVIFASLLHEKPITLELAKLAIKQSSTIEPTDTLTAEDIIDEVCRFFTITKQELLGKKKNKEYVEPRMICTYLITEMLSLPLVAIGKKMGGRDHTTVMHSRDKIAELIKTNTRIYTAVNDIKNLILKK